MNDIRPIIGCDLDDVLLDFMTPLVVWHNTVHNTAHRRDDYFSFDLSKVWECSLGDVNQRIWDFYQSEDHKNALPVDGAQATLQLLKDDYRFVVITAKPDSMEMQMRAWLAMHFGELFEDIVFTNHYHGAGEKRTKSSVCLELNVALFIEDALHNAEDIANVGIPVLLIDTPWNQEKVSPLITRVSSWGDIVCEIQKYAKK